MVTIRRLGISGLDRVMMWKKVKGLELSFDLSHPRRCL